MSDEASSDRDRAIAEFFKALTKLITSSQPLVDQAVLKAKRDMLKERGR